MTSLAPPVAERTFGAPAGAVSKAPKATRETILRAHYWTPALVSIFVTRDHGFRFTPGHYARVGIVAASGHPVFRPLSIASSPADQHLEFLSTLIRGGEFSSCRAPTSA